LIEPHGDIAIAEGEEGGFLGDGNSCGDDDSFLLNGDWVAWHLFYRILVPLRIHCQLVSPYGERIETIKGKGE
jgi:hypothetical protein